MGGRVDYSDGLEDGKLKMVERTLCKADPITLETAEDMYLIIITVLKPFCE